MAHELWEVEHAVFALELVSQCLGFLRVDLQTFLAKALDALDKVFPFAHHFVVSDELELEIEQLSERPLLGLG